MSDKQCVKCLKYRPIDAFYKPKNGYCLRVCKQCRKKQQYDEHGKGVFKQVIHNFVYGVKA